MTTFNGLALNLGNLSRLSSAHTRSISPENFSGEKGQGGRAIEGTGAHQARDLGLGWKISPSVENRGGSNLHAVRYRRNGRDSANLDDAGGQMAQLDFADLLRQTGKSERGMSRQ